MTVRMICDAISIESLCLLDISRGLCHYTEHRRFFLFPINYNQLYTIYGPYIHLYTKSPIYYLYHLYKNCKFFAVFFPVLDDFKCNFPGRLCTEKRNSRFWAILSAIFPVISPLPGIPGFPVSDVCLLGH